MIDRRFFLTASAGLIASLGLPRMAFAVASGDRRFVFIIQRGAADGLAIVAPTGDPAFAGIRGDFARDSEGGARLDSHFTLHSALAETAKLYAAKEALFVHAVASPYRERSHFDGQNILETGGSRAYQRQDGWMNRLLGMVGPGERSALALAATIPPALRGPYPASSYAPSALPDASGGLMSRVAAMYQADAQLHALWSQAVATREMAGEQAASRRDNGAATGALAARLLSGEKGARIAFIETEGWDTHANQRGALARQLRNLDALLAALKSGLGAEWAKTLVIVATEFGRTAAPNGTGGTDHGTASAAMMFGGGLAGGRVIADWPGLSRAELYEGRDLRPTTALDALIAAAIAQHYGLETGRVMSTLFPDARGAAVGESLVRG
ncbi:MAG TPA: DUF1501 domain-containing protein [Sphingomicrobium sp.]|nr:DUF1501 domain-containing protein [Sphingomicrobium sp.]